MTPYFRVMSWRREMCDDFDFHRRPLGQGRNLDRRTGRKRLRKIPRIHPVHLREVTQIRHEHGRFDDIAKIQPLIRQNRLDILQNPFRLRLNAASDQGAICRIERNLPAGKEEISNANGNAVRPNCFRGSCWGNCLWTHTYVDSGRAASVRKIIDFAHRNPPWRASCLAGPSFSELVDVAFSRPRVSAFRLAFEGQGNEGVAKVV